MKTDPITQEHLRKILHYDPASGRFTWLMATSWRVRVGAVAGSVNKRLGYVVIGIGGVTYYAHRLAWLYVHGEMPSDQIDHIDGDPANNALVNLRKASMSENQQNLSAHGRRVERLIGAYERSRDGKFEARIKAGGKSRYLGCFDSEQEAHAAYVHAKRSCHEFNNVRVMRENREVA